MRVDLVEFDRLMRKLLPFCSSGESRELWEKLVLLPEGDREGAELRAKLREAQEYRRRVGPARALAEREGWRIVQ